MRNRRTDDLTVIWLGVAGLVSLFMLATWIRESGVLPWAALGGLIAGAATLRFSRELSTIFVVGLTTATAIALMGIFSVVSPGWYRVW